MTEQDQGGAAALKQPVRFIKSSQFRVIYVEGAYGGLSPRGRISFALYNERTPIPRATEVGLDQAGKFEETLTDSRTGIVREVEAQVTMGIEEAAELARWLSERVAIARDLLAAGQPDA